MGIEADILIEAAMEEANKAIARGDEPYGAVIADWNGNIIARCGNRENTDCNPTHHAEILAIGEAARILGTKNLKGCVLASNYKPCCMCASAILMTGISRVYIGSKFYGFDKLFEAAAQKVRVNNLQYNQNGIKNEECFNQVRLGREKLKIKNPDYTAGHLNGIL